MENHNFSEVEKWWVGDGNLRQINGFWFTSQLFSGVQQVLTEFKPRPNDIIIASCPKAGTTWLKSLVYSIINPSSLQSLVNIHSQDLIPFLEVELFGDDGSPKSDVSLDTTRIFHTHIPYQLLGKILESSDCHVIYITRNPKDALNSRWHFVNKFGSAKENPWKLEDAVERFCRGTIPWGPYYEHVLGYRMKSLKNPDKVFFITYEELKNDTVTHVKKLIEFLGCSFAEEDKKVEEIVKSCSFEVLSNHEVNKSEDYRGGSLLIPNYSFFRQAKVDDYKYYLSEDAIKKIDALTKEKFHKSGFIYGI